MQASPGLSLKLPVDACGTDVASPKEEVAVVLAALVELLRCFTGSKPANCKSQNKLGCVEDPTYLFQQTSVLMVNMPYVLFSKSRSSSANQFIGLWVGKQTLFLSPLCTKTSDFHNVVKETALI